MSLAQASLLRPAIRPVAAGIAPLRRSAVRSAAVQHRLRQNQIRTVVGASKDDLGGPGGQEPPPPNPSGYDKIQRNWVPMLASGAALLGVIAYMSQRSESARARKKTTLDRGEIGEMPMPTGPSIAKQLEDKESHALAELSGRKGGGYGAFRSE